MKRCSHCCRANRLESVVCAFCKGSLAEAQRVSRSDPEAEADLWELTALERGKSRRAETVFALALYVFAVDFIALVPGFTFDAWLFGFSLSALVVGWAIAADYAGRLSGVALQCLSSVALFYFSGALHPGVIYALLGHCLLPMLFAIWMEGLQEMR